MTGIAGTSPKLAIGSLDEQHLVEAAQASRAAFGRLYEMYLPVVYGYLRRRLESREVAEDLTAATFEKAIVALPKYEWRGIPFGAWLVRIASRKLTDYYRIENRRATDPVDPAMVLNDGFGHNRQAVGYDDVAVLAGEAEDLAAVLEALEDLPHRYRQAICLRFLSELTTEEAAEAMGCSRSTFPVVLHRSVKALRRAVERRGHVR